MQDTQNRRSLTASLKQLAEQGSQVDLSIADGEERAAELEIEQVGWVYCSTIFELSSGLTGYMIDLEITNQTLRNLYCRDLELRLPWEDPRFDWMQDPAEEGKSEFYRFPGRNSLELPREDVINHVLLAENGLKPKRPLCGWLLATGGPMPKSLRHGEWIEPTLAIIASNHSEYIAAIRLWVERLEDKRERSMRKQSLYEPLEHNVSHRITARDHQPGRET